MTNRKPRLSAARHVELGAELYDLRQYVMARVIELGNAYPHGDRIARRAVAMLHDVDDLRCWLDSAYGREHPSEFTTDTYYPGHRRRLEADGLGGRVTP